MGTVTPPLARLEIKLEGKHLPTIASQLRALARELDEIGGSERDAIIIAHSRIRSASWIMRA